MGTVIDKNSIQFNYNYVEFEEESSVFSNPDRGWYVICSLSDIDEENLDEIKDQGATLILIQSDLSDFLDKPISQVRINKICSALECARKAGISVIYRAAYTFDFIEMPEPRDINIILNHIKQHKNIFRDYKDVLYSIQAGFLGPWGEWHSSFYSDGDSGIDPEVQKRIIKALLDATPKSLTVALRRPVYIRAAIGMEALTKKNAFGKSAAARLAFHDDAVLSTDSDMGTFSDPDWTRSDELAWINNHALYTPLVAEANYLSDYNDPENAVNILSYMHVQALNMDYHPDIIQKWKETQYGGMSTFDYIGTRLGYRFVFERAGFSESPQRGKPFGVSLRFSNDGFGNLVKAKKIEILLTNGEKEYRFPVKDDVRYWNSGEITDREYQFRLPVNIPVGDWDVYLRIFDASGDPRKSVRFANLGVWDDTKHTNKLGSVYIE